MTAVGSPCGTPAVGRAATYREGMPDAEQRREHAMERTRAWEPKPSSSADRLAHLEAGVTPNAADVMRGRCVPHDSRREGAGGRLRRRGESVERQLGVP